MSKDPLAEFRRERWQSNGMEQEPGNQEPEAGKKEPLTEHQALQQAIRALNQIPNHSLNDEYRDTYELLPALETAYKSGKETEQLRDAAPELLDELINRVGAEEREAAEAGETETPWLNGARAVIAKATPSPSPEREQPETDLEPER